MKILTGISAGLIGFYVADQVLYGGLFVRQTVGFLTSIAAGFGF